MLRRLLLVLVLCLLYATPAWARERYNGICEQGNVSVTIPGTAGSGTQRFQRSFPSCTVTIYLAGTVTLATIYSDDSGTAQANPFTAAATGRFFFYADNGVYDVRLSAGGIPTPFTIGSVGLLDPNASTGLTLDCSAPKYTGANTAVIIANCITSLPSTGGTVDARALNSSPTFPSCPFTGVTKNVVVLMPVAAVTMSADCTIPASVQLQFSNGATIANAANTLTVNGGIINTPPSQIFSGAGTFVMGTTTSTIEAVYPQWWGAKGDGSNNDAAAIQSAVSFLPSGSITYNGGGSSESTFKRGSQITLIQGVYKINSTISIARSSVHIIAQTGTVIDYTGAAEAFLIDSTSDYLSNIILQFDHIHTAGQHCIRWRGATGGERNKIRFGQCAGHSIAGVKFEDGKKNLTSIEFDQTRGGQYGVWVANGGTGPNEHETIIVNGSIVSASVAGVLLESQWQYGYLRLDADNQADNTPLKADIAGTFNTIMVTGISPADNAVPAGGLRLRSTAIRNVISIPPYNFGTIQDDSPPGSNSYIAPPLSGNLLQNGSFEYLNSVARASQWTPINLNQVTELTDIKDRFRSLKLTANTNQSYLGQTLPATAVGQAITVTGWAKALSTNTTTQELRIVPAGAGSNTITTIAKDSRWHLVTATATVASTTGATSVDVRLYVNSTATPSSDVLYLDGFVVTYGSVPELPGTADGDHVFTATGSADFGAWSGQDCQTASITVDGAADGDAIAIGVPLALASTAGVQFSAFVNPADSVQIRGCKITAGASADPAAATITVKVFKP